MSVPDIDPQPGRMAGPVAPDIVGFAQHAPNDVHQTHGAQYVRRTNAVESREETLLLSKREEIKVFQNIHPKELYLGMSGQ